MTTTSTPTADFLLSQVRMRSLCDSIAADDGIPTVRWQCVFNDGADAEYEYLDPTNGELYAVELLRDHGCTVETYDITVKHNHRDTDGFRSRQWSIISSSRMASAVMA